VIPGRATVLALLAAAAAPRADTDSSGVYLDETLGAIGLTAAETVLPIGSGFGDPFRIPLVDSLLAAPLSTSARVGGLVASLRDSASALAFLSERAGRVLEARHRSVTPLARARPSPAESERLGEALDRAGAPAAEQDLVRALFDAGLPIAAAPPATDPALLADAIVRLEEDADDADLDPFELAAKERESLLHADRFYARAESLDVAGVIERHRLLLVTIDALLQALSDVRAAIDAGTWAALEWESAYGRVVLGTTGNDRYEGDALLIVDPGGDDIYPDGAGGTGLGEAPLRIALDLGGDDLYIAKGDGRLAAGIGGGGYVVDVSGDDVYRAGAIGLGAGIAGVGVLVDRGGDDTYLGDRFGQGAGFLGLGALVDARGDDLYRLASYGQGFGLVAGVGVLHDLDGGDRYLFRPRYTDVIRYERHHLSFLQGAALGERPDRSGGVGLLLDDGGNDLYESDIFGQGVAYWFGLGALVDGAGHDVYAGYQYAQGSGVHLAVGFLEDADGDDRYGARGVSQGCGHDLAAGLLVDRRGNDSYVSFDLSQGAGNANGLGLFLDAAGNDAYVVRTGDNTIGYGNPRRDTGSIGVFVDARGADAYTARGDDASVWWGSRYGAGLDAPGAMSVEETWPEDPKVEIPDRSFTDDELFVLAAAGAPKFSRLRDHALDQLERRGADAIPALLAHMGTRIPRERHTLKDIFARMGEKAAGPVASVLDASDVRARREAAWCLGYIGSPLALPALENHIGDPDASVRQEIAGAVGRIARHEPAAGARAVRSVAPLLSDPDPMVRSSACFATSAVADPELLPRLVRALDDSAYVVRVSALDGIVAQDSAAIDALTARAAAPGVGATWALAGLEQIDHDGSALSLLRLEASLASWSAGARVAYAKALYAHRRRESVLDALGRLEGDSDWRVVAIARRSRE
jgi:hypothetical protein